MDRELIQIGNLVEPRSAWTGSYNRLSMLFNLILLLCQRLTNFDMVTLPTVDKHAHLGELQSKSGRNAISKVHYDIVCFLCWWTMRISKCEFDGVQNCLHRNVMKSSLAVASIVPSYIYSHWHVASSFTQTSEKHPRAFTAACPYF